MHQQSMAILLALTGLCIPHTLFASAGSWKVTKTEWSPQDEKDYEAFVTKIGRSDCNEFWDCIRDVAGDTTFPKVYVDCGKLPHMMRAYYSWKHELPFRYESALRALPAPHGDPLPHTNDIRYVHAGSVVEGVHEVIDLGENLRHSGLTALGTLNRLVSSATFRINQEANTNSSWHIPSDLYPVKLSRESIRPGTVMYDPRGHITMVYDVTDDGKVLLMDTHPDNSSGRVEFGRQFPRYSASLGGGFQNWRPIKLVDAYQNDQGEYEGGQLIATENRDLPDYSLEQYYGNAPESVGNQDFTQARFVFKNHVMDEYDYVRHVMATVEVVSDPIGEFRTQIDNLCALIQRRSVAVEEAIKHRIDHMSHPATVPGDIYGTQGIWESYATSSLDNNIRAFFKDVIETTSAVLARNDNGTADFPHSNQLRADLLTALDQESVSPACQIQYTGSRGGKVTLNLNDIQKRLFDISFDPYDCVERRWGATDPSELMGCSGSDSGSTSSKDHWYQAEVALRHDLNRQHKRISNFKLDDLLQIPVQDPSSTEEADALNIRKFLGGS